MEKIERLLRAYQCGVINGMGGAIEFLDDRLPTPVVIVMLCALAGAVGLFSPPWLLVVLVFAVVVPWVAFVLEMFVTMLYCEALRRSKGYDR